MEERIDVVVIGGGQAGLATSHELTRSGVEHVVLERERVGSMWRGRWDSFCLVTPNWTLQLPGHPYDGTDPDGFLLRDEIVTYLERYASMFDAPIREGIEVTSLEASPERDFLLKTSAGDIRARCAVVSTGAYQRAQRPSSASSLPADLFQIDVDGYRNPDSIPAGRVLVIGSGQSGCQIAEELHEAGREVFLSCGRAPWAPRRIGQHDVVWWAIETGFLDAPVSSLPTTARLAANILATGRGGGHDLHLRTLREAGVTLVGHFLGAEGRRADFAGDVGESVAWGDERFGQLTQMIRKLADDRGLPMPDIPEPGPIDGRAPEHVDLAGFGAVIFAGGFRPDYQRWIRVPEAFDDLGFPVHAEGASAAAPGLYFVGVHFLRKRKSSLFYGVGEDAAIVAGQIGERLASSPVSA